MAADARIGAHALGHDGGGIMWTARAEVGNALSDVGGLRRDALELLQPRHPGADIVTAVIVEQPLAEADCNLVGIERAFDREQPIAGFVLLADADRLVGGAVKLFADLHLDQRAFFLDHDDQIEAFGKFLQLALAERPDASDLVQPDAKLVALELIDAEFVETLPDVEITLAGRDDA